MIERRLSKEVGNLLEQQAAVCLLGPRQVGKTTLALELAEGRPSVYLDLESESARNRLSEAELYLNQHSEELVVIDEIQRMPGLFEILRGVIDKGRREGRGVGRFMLLGSASPDLLKQSGETLAGRIAYLELEPLEFGEVGVTDSDRLWVRGGFPESFLASHDQASLRWREDFIRTYLERDIPQLGPRIPAETLRRFWAMLAHRQGGLMNAAAIASGLGVSGSTVAAYLDLMVDLLLVRKLEPWATNAGKRLVRSPKVYVRDSGLLHCLLGIGDVEALLGHPVAGPSWEGFVIENLVGAVGSRVTANFYRSSGGAEVDLVLTWPDSRRWAIEVKRSAAPKVDRGFHSAWADLNPDRGFVVYPGPERYPLGDQIDAISPWDLAELLTREG